MLRIPVLDVANKDATEQMYELLYNASNLLAYMKYDVLNSQNNDEIAQECLNVIQITLGLLCIVSPEECQRVKQLLRHELKLKCEESQNKVKILGWLNIDYKVGY